MQCKRANLIHRIVNNNDMALQPGTFKAWKYLTSLSLTYNNLTYIPSGVLDPLAVLVNLYV